MSLQPAKELALPSPPEIGPDKSLATLADFTKWLTGLSTAGLVFSIGLQQNIASYHSVTRWCVVIAWAFYALSVVAGVFIQSAFPLLYEDKKFSVRNGWMLGTYQVAFWSLVAGSFAVFLALFSLTWMLPDPGSLVVKDASDAVARARVAATGRDVENVEVAETLKGADATDVSEEVWHLRFALRKAHKGDQTSKIDVFIKAVDGMSTVVSAPIPVNKSTSVR